MSNESDVEERLAPCPNCGSRAAAARESEEYVLEDGTKRRMTFCTACMRETADGTLRYEVISEEFIRTEIDRKMHDD
jgi:DNA-directed RNA polymerase subunit K/omega